MQDGLLLAKGHIVVPDKNNLRVLIIKEVYNQKAIAYLGEKKTIRVLRERYYWKGITGDIK